MHVCAGIHEHGQMLGLITCCERRKFFDVPHIQPTWRASSLGQIQEIPLSESALLVTGVDRPGVATSDGDESGVDVNTACAEEPRVAES